MTRPHGRMNKNVFKQLNSATPGSGLLRVREVPAGNFITDVYAPIVEMQKNSVFVVGAGKLVILGGNLYIPAYTTVKGGDSVQQAAGSGFTAPQDGVYYVEGSIAVSGSPNTTYAGSVLAANLPVSGTTTAAFSSANGAAIVPIHGFVHVASGTNINIGVVAVNRAGSANITTIGIEELVVAPAANLFVFKLPSNQPNFTG